MNTDGWYPIASTLCPLSLPAEKRMQVGSHSHAQNEAQMNHLQIFPDYWCLFRMLHTSYYSSGLAEERARKKKKERKKERKREGERF